MLAHVLLIAALQSSPAPASAAPAQTATASPAPAPSEDPNVTKIARAQYDAFASGKIDQRQYPQPIPQEAIAQVQAGLSQMGAVKSVTLLRTMSTNGATVYIYKFTCANGAALEALALKGGKIVGIRFSPAS